MKLRDPAGWEASLEANREPDGWGRDPAEWEQHYDGADHEERGAAYGAVVLIAAERWADRMEQLLDEGWPLAEIADEAFRDVNRELGNWGLTGFQYGAAVSLLAQCWEHGEELRRWHNLATQIGDEGERANENGTVLNPALLNFGSKE